MYMIVKNKFDKVKYDNRYIKDHFKQLKIALKPDLYNDIKETAASECKSVTQYLIDIHLEHKNKSI